MRVSARDLLIPFFYTFGMVQLGFEPTTSRSESGRSTNWAIGACNSIFSKPSHWALGIGKKVKYHLISITKSISKVFISNFLCSYTLKIWNILNGIFVHAPGAPRGSKSYLFKHGHVAYQIDGNYKYNIMQLKKYFL